MAGKLVTLHASNGRRNFVPGTGRKKAETDKNGNFRIEGVIPDLDYMGSHRTQNPLFGQTEACRNLQRADHPPGSKARRSGCPPRRNRRRSKRLVDEQRMGPQKKDPADAKLNAARRVPAITRRKRERIRSAQKDSRGGGADPGGDGRKARLSTQAGRIDPPRPSPSIRSG